MPADHDPPRREYRQTRRAELAAQTRTRIRDSARILLLDRGYAGTSMRAVADHAGVGLRTVYDNFPTKTDLLKDVVQTAIVGDPLPVPAGDRDWFQNILDEADPTRRAALLAQASTRLHQRTAALFTVARSAAADDPEVAQLWRTGKAGHRSDCERFARAVLGERTGHAVQDAAALDALTAMLYVLVGPETYTLLTDELGLTAPSYQKWLETQLTGLFEQARRR